MDLLILLYLLNISSALTRFPRVKLSIHCFDDGTIEEQLQFCRLFEIVSD
jgi:hypothetical protein